MAVGYAECALFPPSLSLSLSLSLVLPDQGLAAAGHWLSMIGILGCMKSSSAARAPVS
jgi:hypothetical protein